MGSAALAIALWQWRTVSGLLTTRHGRERVSALFVRLLMYFLDIGRRWSFSLHIHIYYIYIRALLLCCHVSLYLGFSLLKGLRWTFVLTLSSTTLLSPNVKRTPFTLLLYFLGENCTRTAFSWVTDLRPHLDIRLDADVTVARSETRRDLAYSSTRRCVSSAILA